MQDRADLIGRLLVGRLEKHILQKIHDKSKHDHWCIIFVHDNLNRFAALIVFFKHTTIHPHSVTEISSLLRNPNKKSGYIFVTCVLSQRQVRHLKPNTSTTNCHRRYCQCRCPSLLFYYKYRLLSFL